MTAGSVAGVNDGGAIFIQDENVTLTNCTFSNNASADAAGAVRVEAAGATLTVNRCTFTSNTAPSGGAISAAAAIALTIQDSTFTSNQAIAGGAINQFQGGSLLILGSTFRENTTSTSDGGGLFLNGAFISAILRNSTFSGNIANSDGGAVAMGTAFTGSLTVQNCSLVSNTATLGNGGGIVRVGGTAIINLVSSILNGNGVGTSGPDVFTTGTVNASVCMIASSAGVTTFMGDAFTNANLGVNPMIGPLANNGGFTFTYALLTGSPAIDRGSNPAGLTTDQRGAGFPRVVVGLCNGSPVVDIGAFEVQGKPPGCLPCPADINQDNIVNIDDLVQVITNWGACP